MQKQVTIGWKVSTLDLNLASLRYRAMLPLLALEQRGIKSRIFTDPSRSRLAGLDALVIVKSFTIQDYWLAQEAARSNIPVIFDLCDNIFIEQYKDRDKATPADLFMLIASVADAIVVTTEPLVGVVRERIGRHTPIYVVPDGIETDALLEIARTRLRHAYWSESGYRIKRTARFILGSLYRAIRNPAKLRNDFGRVRAKLKSFLPKWRTKNNVASNAGARLPESDAGKAQASAATPRKILWFGNHGAKHANFGMLDLLSIREPLEKLAAELPVELVVVSNNVEKYKKHIRPLAIPSRYIEWSAEAMASHLASADVVVIPNSLDPFSICKSANRSVLALTHGVPVVATATPALEALRGCITLDDFEGGLRRYLTDAQYARGHVEAGKKTVEQVYGQPAIGRLWNDLINKVIHSARARHSLRSPALIVAIQLPQDIDLAQPVLGEARRRGIPCAVWTSMDAMQRWPQIAESISNLDLESRVFPDNLKGFGTDIFPKGVLAFLSVTETNLKPHRFTHRLTKLANLAGLYTATMQHGYENVGLTYGDALQEIKSVEFASQQIYTWGPLETLHPDIRPDTLNKCVPVGCPKPTAVTPLSLADQFSEGQTVIGVFENLHWLRYTDEYRKFFLDGINRLAEEFPDVVFLVKPHSAGMWLTNRYLGAKPQGANLLIADPKDPRWRSISAPQLLGRLTAVITTPSTVALDAARVEIPIAVVAQQLDLENYVPLPMIRGVEDWSSFIRRVLDSQAQQSLRQYSREFVGRVLLPGDAASRMVDAIISNKQKQEQKQEIVDAT